MENKKKERLDILLVNKGLAESREKAKVLIMTGNVFVNGQREDKAGTKVEIKSNINIKSNPIPFVSRGGLKLDKAIKSFKIDLNNKVCMDIGASTGGFTDCMLKNGAKKVYAIDVGYGQLAWKLRQDDRVICMEKTNIRYVKPEDIGELVEFVSIDVSFISLEKVIPVVKELMNKNACCVCLIKPQFEAGREKVGKKGVVRDPNTHIEVITRIIKFVLKQKFNVLKIDYSPVKGPEGNIEYLLYIDKDLSETIKEEKILETIKDVVDMAHKKL